MKKIGKKHLESIVPYKPGKPIDEVKRELNLEDVIKLASNEHPLGPSKKAVEAIIASIGQINRYPDGGCYYLRKILSQKLSIPSDNLVFGNGSDEVIILALNALAESGDEIVISDPTFMVYRIASLARGIQVKSVPAKDFKYDLEGMLDAVTDKTRIVFIANPDNPTGTYVNQKELENFIERIPENVVVFIDEAYYEFAKGGDYPETIDLIKREDKNVIISRTFSKAYSLAGLRIGYGIAREDIAVILNKVREPFNVNSLAQVAAAAALEDQDYLEKSVALIKEEKKRYYSFFDSLNINYIPSRTNFILLNIGEKAVKLYEYLLNNGVIVRDMSSWGLNGFMRVNIGLKEENDKFFKVFKEFFENKE